MFESLKFYCISNHAKVWFCCISGSTHLRRVESSASALWTGLLLIAGCLVSFYYYYANSVDPDQTPRSVASALSALLPNYPFGCFQTEIK